MKLKAFPALLSLIVSCALGYLAWHIAGDDEGSLVVGIGTGVAVLSTLLPLLALRLENGRQSVNMKAWSFAALIVLLAVYLGVALLGVAEPYYAVTRLLLRCLHLLVVWKLAEIKDV